MNEGDRVSSATNVIAFYAAVVSTASFFVAFLAYRASGPKVTAQAFVTGEDEEKQRLHVTIATEGSSETTMNIEGLLCMVLSHPGFAKYITPRPRLFKIKLEGPELPYRMPGHDIAHWSVDLDSTDVTWNLSRELRLSDKPYVVIRTGGRARKVPIAFVEERVVFRGTNLPRRGVKGGSGA